MSFSKIKLTCAFIAAFSSYAAASAGVFAQSPPRPEAAANGGASAPVAASSAQALYEEAESYVRRKFDEFAKKNIPFSRNLEAVTYQEQRELALKHAATIAAREAELRGLDLYYTGLLYALAGKPEQALDALRRFLAEGSGAAPAFRQKARVVFVQHAVEQNLAAEAEKVLADYAREEPRAPAEAHRMNSALATYYHKKKDYERAAARAREAYRITLGLARGKTLNARQRADTVYGTGAFLVDALVRSKQRAEALGVIQEMRSLSLELPSARLYGSATVLLLDNGEPLTAPPVGDASTATAPEIKVEHWIDQQPARLADLRGRVVLLDFWATWCGPCRFTIPKLNALHKKYNARG
ncbi:MAG TPA: TlpA disulfide reductase family protein, partial [Pyrinomonadaceae bacterium]|nr:TlpA disulfide reductase family protein [Pyrinomonadaceae bacterium]